MKTFTVYFPQKVEIPNFLSERFNIQRSKKDLHDMSNPHPYPQRSYVIWGREDTPGFVNLSMQEDEGYDFFPNYHELERGSMMDLFDISRELYRAGRPNCLIGDQRAYDIVRKGPKIHDERGVLRRFLGVLNQFQGKPIYAARFSCFSGEELVNAISVADVLMRQNGGIVWDPGARRFSEEPDMEQIEKYAYRSGWLWRLVNGENEANI
jgi:hypothetical protein